MIPGELVTSHGLTRRRVANTAAGKHAHGRRHFRCAVNAPQQPRAETAEQSNRGNTHVCPHWVVTGLSKISRHTGHKNSDTSLPPSHALFLCCAPFKPPSIAISFLPSVSCCCCCCVTSLLPLLQGAELLLTLLFWEKKEMKRHFLKKKNDK